MLQSPRDGSKGCSCFTGGDVGELQLSSSAVVPNDPSLGSAAADAECIRGDWRSLLDAQIAYACVTPDVVSGLQQLHKDCGRMVLYE